MFEFDLNSQFQITFPCIGYSPRRRHPQLWILKLWEKYLNIFLQESSWENTYWCGNFSDLLLSINIKKLRRLFAFLVTGQFNFFFSPLFLCTGNSWLLPACCFSAPEHPVPFYSTALLHIHHISSPRALTFMLKIWFCIVFKLISCYG